MGDHPVLGPRLESCHDAVLSNAAQIQESPNKTIFDGARIEWFLKSPQFSKIANLTERMKEIDLQERKFISDRYKFASHVKLFSDQAKLFSDLAGIDARSKAFYLRLHDKAARLDGLCLSEGLKARSAPDEASWVPLRKMTRSRHEVFLRQLQSALAILDEAKNENMPVPPSEWYFIQGGTSFWAAKMQGLRGPPFSCKPWCSELAAKLA